MVAIATILGFITALAGAMTGKYFLILIGIFVIAIPLIGGALILGDIPWWVIFGVIVIFIYMFSGGKKR